MDMTIYDYKNDINAAIHKTGFKPFFLVSLEEDDLLVQVNSERNEMLPYYDELKIIIDNYISQLRVVPKKLKINYSNGITNDILYISPNFKY